MKRILLICFFFANLFVQSFGQSSCTVTSPTWSFSNCSVSGDTIYFNYGDTAKVTLGWSCIRTGFSCFDCTIYPPGISGNGVISLANFTYGVTDTGIVTIQFRCYDSHCGPGTYSHTFYFSYTLNA